MADVQRMAAQVADLMSDRLRLRAGPLAVVLRRAGRRLPRKVRRAGLELVRAEALSAHPRCARMVDGPRVSEAHATCVSYLKPLGSKERFRAAALSFAGTVALMVLVLGAGLVAVLAWRDFL